MFDDLEGGAYSSLYTEKPYDLDVRDFKPKGRTLEEKATSLAKYIQDTVKDTQRVVTRSFPDKLIISKHQYDLLNGGPQLFSIDDVGQEFWLYRTKHNVMELIVE